MLKKLIIVLVLILVGLQFYRPDITPPEDAGAPISLASVFPDAPPYLRSACFDCHSYESDLPWYAQINPIGIFVRNHILEGREHMNFSTISQWTEEEKRENFKECAEEIEKGNMPIESYTWLHPAARLTDEERQNLVTWFTMKSRE